MWVPVALAIIPAEGPDHRPHNYRLVDTPAQATTRYRLLGVNLRGEAQALAEVAVKCGVALRAEVADGDLRIACRGQHIRSVTLDTSSDPVQEPWEPVTFALGRNEPMRFYRIRE